MKKTAFTLLIFFVTLTVQAQLKKGQWIIGGLIDFSSNHSTEHYPTLDDTKKITTYRAIPWAGYFFMDKLCAGIGLNFSGTKFSQEQVGFNPVYSFNLSADNNATGIGIAPFLRYYCFPSPGKFNLFVDASYAFMKERSKSKYRTESQLPGYPPNVNEGTENVKYTGNYISLSAGPVLFISKRVSFELSGGYAFALSGKSEQPDGQLYVGTGFQVHFGKN